MLLQQRAEGKYHSGGLWTNTCCSHPAPGETTDAAVDRRLKEEMGFNTPVQKIFDFVYRAPFDNGLTEYEFDHVYAGEYEGAINPDPQEVMAYEYRDMNEIETAVANDNALFSAWFVKALPLIKSWWQQRYPAQ